MYMSQVMDPILKHLPGKVKPEVDEDLPLKPIHPRKMPSRMLFVAANKVKNKPSKLSKITKVTPRSKPLKKETSTKEKAS